MTTQYLVPCTCGEKLAVDRSQAGLSLRCRCGTEVAVPTLRGLAQLERAPVAAERGPEWGPRQALLFAGSLLTALALLAVLGLRLTAPRYPQTEVDAQLDAFRTASDIEKLTLKESFDFWDQMHRALQPIQPRVVLEYDLAAERYRRRMRIAIVAGGAGLLLLCLALAMPKPGRSR